MNDHILNMLKADLTVLDKLEIKPNFADLARKYKMDYRTVKKYYEGYEGKPKNRKTKSKLDPYASIIEEKLSISRISHKGIYRMLLSQYGEKEIGSYTNFMSYCKKNKLSPDRISAGNPKYETEPGDLAEVDWKESIKLYNRSGEFFEVNIFHIVLKFSRYSYIELTLSKEQNVLLRVLINSFRFFRGVPNRLLFDNMSTVAIVGGKTKKIHPRIVQFSKDFGFEARLCRARSPETKGTNEARNKILDTVRAYDHEFDTYEELSDIVVQLNSSMNISRCAGTNISPVLLYYKEKEYLHPMPRREIVESYLEPAKVKVANTQLIYYKGCQYSVDRSLINEYVQPEEFNGKLYLYYKGKCVASHSLTSNPINYASEHYTQLMDHKVKQEDIESTVNRNLEIMNQLNEIRKVEIQRSKAFETAEGMIAYIIQETRHNAWIIRFLSSLNEKEKAVFYQEMKKLYPFVKDESQFYLAFKHALDRNRLKKLRFDFWLLQENCNYDFLNDDGYEEIGNEFQKDIEEYYSDRIENETKLNKEEQNDIYDTESDLPF